MLERPIGKLVIVGVGLLGASFALALRRAGAVGSIVGVGRSRANLDAAAKLDIADRYYRVADPWTPEVADADLVLIATPVGEIPSLLAAVAPALGRETIVTDVGSTKQDVVAAAREQLRAALPRFVPGHPIAGSERSGAGAASAALFEGRTVVLTPLAETDPAAVACVAACWTRCGGHVRELDAGRHDAIMASVSHLPHLLAYAFVTCVAERSHDDALDYAATGFRDFTRLASSHPEMWRDVCLANRDAVRRELAAYRGELDRVDVLLARGDGAGLLALFERARTARDDWLARRDGAD